MTTPAELARQEIEVYQSLLVHWTAIKNHAHVEGAKYHRSADCPACGELLEFEDGPPLIEYCLSPSCDHRNVR